MPSIFSGQRAHKGEQETWILNPILTHASVHVRVGGLETPVLLG